jgi:hypothetical protein
LFLHNAIEAETSKDDANMAEILMAWLTPEQIKLLGLGPAVNIFSLAKGISIMIPTIRRSLPLQLVIKSYRQTLALR